MLKVRRLALGAIGLTGAWLILVGLRGSSAAHPQAFDVPPVGALTPSATVSATPTALLPATATPLPTATIPPACGPPWSIVPSPNIGLGSNRLNGVAAVSPTDLWAVGSYTTTTGLEQPLIEHWDGTRWTIHASPNPGTLANRLHAVLALSPTDLWAVGYSFGPTATLPLALHGDGNSWTVIPVPGFGHFTALAAISPTDLWAVGWSEGAPTRVLTAHWDGSQWTVVSGPTYLDPYDSYLYGVAMVGPNDVWAVGTYYFGLFTLTMHWDGLAWTHIPSPSTNSPGSVLAAVTAFAANNVWAVGTCCKDPEQGIALQWDGSSWELIALPSIGIGLDRVYGVTAVSPTDMWAVGSSTHFRTLTFHWDGSQWVRVPGPDPPSWRVLMSVGMLSATDVWAVGHDGFHPGILKRTAVLHYAGPCLPTTPTPTATPCPVQFTDVPTSDAFYPYIRCLACRGVVSGYADGTFRPGANVTRGQVSKLVAAAAALSDPVPSTQQTFADVPNTNPFWLWIERLAGRGVISGYICGGAGEPCDPQQRPYFRWGAALTRGQLAKIAANTVPWADAIPVTQQTFTDVPPTQPFWLYIERVLAHGVVSGYADGTFRPGAPVTRAQTAKIVANTFFPNCQTP